MQTSALSLLRWNAVQFIINVRENCKVSHTAIEQIIDGVTNFVKLYSSIILVRFIFFYLFIYKYFFIYLYISMHANITLFCF